MMLFLKDFQCRFCRQGRLFFYKLNNEAVFCCEECELCWKQDDYKEPCNGILSFDVEDDLEEASHADLILVGERKVIEQ